MLVPRGYAGTTFAVNVEHADSHRHVETNGWSAVTAESDNDRYSALMLTIDSPAIHCLNEFLVTGASLSSAEFYLASQTEAMKQKYASSCVT